MKVLLVDVNCKGSSTGKIVYDLYTHLRKNGHQAAICYGRGKVIDEPDIHRISSSFEVYFHALMTRLTGFTGCYSYFATRKLIRFIEQYKPDVVHLHELHGYYVNIIPVINFLKKKKIKTIWTFHCEFMYTGRCGLSYDCEKWTIECKQCSNKKEYPASLIFDFSKKMFNKKKKAFEGFNNLLIVSPSKWLADRVRRSFLSDKRIIIIPNGIDLNIFKPSDCSVIKSRYGMTIDKVVVYVTASFDDENKGGKYILDLAKRLPDVRFIIIGNKRPIAKLPANAEAIGYTENQQELAMYYSMADLSLITSRIENFPTVCIESLCCGTPVIGFAGGGTIETAPDNYGYFVPFGDIDQLDQTIKRILKGEIQLKSKEECAGFGKLYYNDTVMASNYSELYKDKLM